MKKSLLSLALTTMMLAACGGGSSSSNDTPEKPVDPVAAASEKVAKDAGLAAITAASADEVVYDVVADIGDTWRIVLNTKTNQFTVKVLQTLFSLKDVSGTFTASTSGNITTFTGTGFKLRVDNRSKSATGAITVGNKTAGVTGSGYAVGDIAKLAGIYSYGGATRNVSGLVNADVPAGQFKISNDGTMLACESGVFDASGVCAAVPGGDKPNTSNAKLVKDEKTGVISLLEGTRPVGIVHVQAGDRGPVLMIDRFGVNSEGINRTGVLFASKPVQIKSGDLDGSYACSNARGEQGVAEISGAKVKVTNRDDGKTHEENVYYNKISTGSQLVDLNGFVTFLETGHSATDVAVILPLSSTAFVAFMYDSAYVDQCVKQ